MQYTINLTLSDVIDLQWVVENEVRHIEQLFGSEIFNHPEIEGRYKRYLRLSRYLKNILKEH